MKVAVRKVVRGPDGTPKVMVVDANTGQPVTDLTGYTFSSASGINENKPAANAEKTAQSENTSQTSIANGGGDNYYTGDLGTQKAKAISTSLFGVDYYPNAPSRPTTSVSRNQVQRALNPEASRVERTQQTNTKSYSVPTEVTETDLPERQMSQLNVNLAGAKRSEMPTSGIQNQVQDVVTDLFGPGYSVELFSGKEPEGTHAVGSNRHPAGYAGDFRVYDPQGNMLTVEKNPEAFQDLSQMMAARYGTNVGFGKEYMGGVGIHLDNKPASKLDPGQAQQWASGAKGMSDVLDEARQLGTLPDSYFNKMTENAPVPQARPVDAPVTEAPELGMNRTFTPEDKSLMAVTLAGEIDQRYTDLSTEAGRMEAMGILSTMENRAPKYGGIESAILADNQYSTWNNARAANTANSNYAKNPDLFNSLVEAYATDPKNNLGFTSYYNPSIANPSWGTQMQNSVDLGPHKFGTLSEYLSDNTPQMSAQAQMNERSTGQINNTANDSWSSSSGRDMAFSSPDTSSWSSNNSINDNSNRGYSESRESRATNEINSIAGSGWANDSARDITSYSSDGWSSSSINSTAGSSWANDAAKDITSSAPDFGSSKSSKDNTDYSASDKNTNSFGGPR